MQVSVFTSWLHLFEIVKAIIANYLKVCDESDIYIFE